MAEVTPEMEAYAQKRLREREQQDVLDTVRAEIKALHRKIEISRKELSAKIDTSNHIKEQILQPVAKVAMDVDELRKQGDALERVLGAWNSEDYLVERGTALAARMHIPVFESDAQVKAAIAYAELASATTVLERRKASMWDRADKRVKVVVAILGVILLVIPAVLSTLDHFTPRTPAPVTSPSHHP